jgi:uncharacterized protein YwqG
MRSFKSLEELQEGLEAIGADDTVARYMLGNARPTLTLLRNYLADDRYPVGGSKFGGDPDLPASMDWPMRPAYPDAKERRRELKKAVKEWESDGNSDLAAEDRELMRLVGEPFPLSFVCQLDLAALSREGGTFFHPLLPQEGWLLVFVDEVAWQQGEASDRVAMRLIWHKTPQEQLARRSAPAPLVRWYEEFKPHSSSPRWSDLTFTSGFTPEPVYTIPDVPTVDIMESEAFTDLYRDTFQELQALPVHEDPDRPQKGSNFGDQLGGWAEQLQDSLQMQAQLNFHGADLDEMQESDAERLLEGSTEWKLLLCIGCEVWSGTRTLLGHWPDGLLYVMMRDEDVEARRFENAWMIMQST